MKRLVRLFTYTVILSILTFFNLSAQNCASVELPDQEICPGESATLCPVIDLTGYAVEAVDSVGNVDHLYYSTGEPDGNGSYFCRGSSGPYTRGVWKMPCTLPSGTQVCIRIKVNSSSKNANYKIYGGANSITNPSTASYTLLSTKNHGGNSYQDICITLSSAYRYIKIQDEGGSPFYVDAIKYTLSSSCTPSYSWSNGDTTQTITVSPSSNTSYSVATTICGVTYNSSATVSIKACYPISCVRKVSNTRGCSSTPYILWLKDKNNNTYALNGDSTDYQWIQYSNGDARLIATDLSASGLSGTYDVDLLYSGYATSAPANSPKTSSCFTTGSSTGWVYWTNLSGTITSSTYGTISISRMGPSMQMGNNANITQSGFGASGWLNTAGAGGQFIAGDINIMLSQCNIVPPTPVSCTTGDYKWENTVTVNGNTVSSALRFIDGQVTSFKLPNLPSDFSSAVKITVDEVVSWDGYANRVNVSQPTETWKIVFFKNGSVAYETPYTTDVPDNVASGEWIGGLGVATTFASGVDSILLVHYEDPSYGTGSASTANSVVPVGVCISYETVGNTIKGTVWNDNDNDQTIDAGENGRGNVTVCLYNDANGNGVLDASETTAIECKETDSNGDYEFSVIYSGGTENYILTTETGDYPSEFEFTTDNIETVSFTSGGNTVADKDFGYMEPNTINGRVFLDSNVDGDLDSGEPRESGVVVYLYADTDGDGVLDASETTPIDSAVTDVNGFYEFSVYYSGSTDDYIIGINDNDLPDNSTLTTDDYQTAQFTSSVQTDVENDFGYKLPNVIQGTVFNDQDGDGVKDASEPLYSGGVTIYLYNDADNDGVLDASESTPIDSVVSDASGEFEFVVEYTGGTNSFLMNSKESDYPGGAYNTTGNLEAAQFTSGGNTDSDNEFGFDAANTITGTVYNDYDADGSQDTGEPGKSGIKVYLYKDANGNGSLDPFELASPIDSTVTNSNGDYSFGVEYIPSTTDKFFTKSNLDDYPAQSSLTTDNVEDATFTSGNNTDPDNDFGFRETNTIKGTVFNDFDGDGVADTGEPGESGITVYLYNDANNNGVLDASELTPIDSAVSDANGDYQFVQPYTGGTNSFLMTTNTDGYPNGSALTTDNLEASSFTSGNNTDENNDFGFNEFNAISGTVYNDYNKNQTQETGEDGEAGITVYLYNDADNDGVLDASELTPIDSAVTNSNGDYNFSQPFTGGTNSFIVNTKTADYPTNSALTTDNIETASFTSGGNSDPENNFGFNEVNKITGTVFLDADLDGVLDAGETKRSGVDVYLYEDLNNNGILDAGETSVIDTKVTDSNGEYSFTVDYTGGTNSFIVRTDEADYPAMTYFTTDEQEVASFTSGNNVDPNNDFGYNLNNEISGTVFEDTDSDGFNDVGETGTYNVLVILYDDANSNGVLDAAESILDSMRTDAQGNYTFEVPYTGGTNSFIVKTDTTTLPVNSSLTTDNIETASFTSGGNSDPNNDFGHDGCSTNAGLVGPNTTCAKEDQLFAVSPAVSGASYAWTFSGPSTPSTSTAASQLVQWDSAGVYNIELIVSITGCTDTFNKAINVTAAVYASAVPADTVCRGGETVLDGTASSTGVSFDWTIVSGDVYSIDIGPQTSQPTVSPLVTTVYKMTVTDQLNGCSRVDFVTVNVDVNLNPTAVIDAVDPVCEGELLSLDGSNSQAPVSNSSATLGHYWFADGSLFRQFQDTAMIRIDSTTQYKLVVVDLSTTCADTAEVSVTPLLKPVVTTSKVDPTCQLDNGQIVFTITDNATRTSLELSIDGGATYPYTVADNSGTYTLSGLAEGTYNLSARWSNDDCPVSLGAQVLTDNTVIPTVSALNAINGGSFIPGDTVKLEGQDVLDLYANSNASGSFAWSGPNSFSESTQGVNVTLSASYADTGNYIVEYTNSDGCSIMDSVYVDVKVYNTISGTVYKDNNDNSDLDATEPGLAGVTIYLYNDANGNGTIDLAEATPISSDVTDANGYYDFKLLYVGGTDNFIITTERTDYPDGIRYTEESDNQREVQFAAGNLDSPNNDYGYVPNMGIGSTVFHDENRDGVQNNGETGIAGVIIQVFADANGDGTADNSTVLGTDTTDSNGNYYIGQLIPSKYVVVIPSSNFDQGDALKAFPASSSGNGTDDGTDGDDNGIQANVGGTTISATIELTEGGEPQNETGQGSGQETSNGTIDENGDMTVDFGFYCGCDISLAGISSKAIIVSDVDPVNLSFDVSNAGNEPLENVTISGTYSTDGGTTNTSLSAANYVSGDVNANSKIDLGEVWKYQITGATFSYTQGQRVEVKAVVRAEACDTVEADFEFVIRTFGTNVDVVMPDDCFLPGDTIQVGFITRLLIDEDYEKAPTNSAGNPIPRVRYNAYLQSFTITGVNNGNSFDPFNPPSNVNIAAYQVQGADSGRVGGNILDECEPVNSVKLPCTGTNQDVSCEFPDWTFIVDVVIPNTTNLDSFVVTAQDIFDVDLLLESGVGTNVFSLLTTLTNQTANDSGKVYRCEQDFGDLRDEYGTADTSNGAYHLVKSNLRLGFLIDSEHSGAPSVNGDGDDVSDLDDEDGWLNPSLVFSVSDTVTMNFRVFNNTGTGAFLTAFIDADDDRAFDSLEIVSVGIPDSSGYQNISMDYIVPLDVIDGDINIRFRLTTDPNIGSKGPASDGEVEDYGGITAVPVSLISLNAELINTKDVLVTWSTASEINNDRFEVERRFEGESEFTYIGQESGNGTTNSIKNYRFVDDQNNWPSTIAYYRLKQVDYDGTEVYTEIVAVTKKGAVEAIVYPNPTQNQATVTILSDSKTISKSLNIVDMFGKDVTPSVGIADLNGAYTIDTRALRNGTYFIELIVNNQKVVKRLTITR